MGILGLNVCEFGLVVANFVVGVGGFADCILLGFLVVVVSGFLGVGRVGVRLPAGFGLGGIAQCAVCALGFVLFGLWWLECFLPCMVWGLFA